MTNQVPDTVAFRGADYALVGVCGDGLFDPRMYGLHPVEISSACWRGYQCDYLVSEDGNLLLRQVVVALDGAERQAALSGEGPLLFGCVPEKRLLGFAYLFDGTHVPYTGGIAIGSEEANSPLVDWFSVGFYGYGFKDVWELIFVDGRFIHSFERSQTLEELRRSLEADTKRRKKKMDERKKWLDEQFYLQPYDWPLYHT